MLLMCLRSSKAGRDKTHKTKRPRKPKKGARKPDVNTEEPAAETEESAVEPSTSARKKSRRTGGRVEDAVVPPKAGVADFPLK